jgi:hypothetical protein
VGRWLLVLGGAALGALWGHQLWARVIDIPILGAVQGDVFTLGYNRWVFIRPELVFAVLFAMIAWALTANFGRSKVSAAGGSGEANWLIAVGVLVIAALPVVYGFFEGGHYYERSALEGQLHLHRLVQGTLLSAVLVGVWLVLYVKTSHWNAATINSASAADRAVLWSIAVPGIILGVGVIVIGALIVYIVGAAAYEAAKEEFGGSRRG